MYGPFRKKRTPSRRYVNETGPETPGNWRALLIGCMISAMTRPHPLVVSLETAAQAGDPAEAIYARLFSAHPELEAEFHMDLDGGVRGSMLSQAFDVLLDLAEGDGLFAAAILSTERANHYGYGVPPDMFFMFLGVIRDWVREALGEAWTAEMEEGWNHVLEKAQKVAA